MKWNGISVFGIVKKLDQQEYSITGANGQINKGFYYPVYLEHGDDIEKGTVPETVYNLIEAGHRYICSFEVTPPVSKFDKTGRPLQTTIKIHDVVCECSLETDDNTIQESVKMHLSMIPFDAASQDGSKKSKN